MNGQNPILRTFFIIIRKIVSLVGDAVSMCCMSGVGGGGGVTKAGGRKVISSELQYNLHLILKL